MIYHWLGRARNLALVVPTPLNIISEPELLLPCQRVEDWKIEM